MHTEKDSVHLSIFVTTKNANENTQMNTIDTEALSSQSPGAHSGIFHRSFESVFHIVSHTQLSNVVMLHAVYVRKENKSAERVL